MSSSDKIIFTSPSRPSETTTDNRPPWVVLVIDDEQGVLDVTYNVLKRFHFKGRSLQLENAKSLDDAIALYHKFPNAAVALIDCTMEKNTSGLDFIDFVRHEKNNTTIQLVLRTGQPGFAPETEVLTSYEINDYLSKTELTSSKLKHRMISYLRAYENLVTISEQNSALQHANFKISVQNNALEQLDKVKDNFLSFVSHELRSPLRASQGLIHLLLSNDSLNREFISNLELIESCNQRMDSLVGDLIDSAMIRLNEFRVKFSENDLHQTIADIMPNLHMLAKYMDKDETVEIINNIPKSLPIIKLDASRIQQVIINLVSNALKHTESGTVNISAEETPRGIAVSVIDTGDGIDNKDIPNIFEMFSQAESPLLKEQEGLGLGLCIAQKIIDSHKGTLSATSTKGIGSTFTFEIPISQE